MIFLWGEGKKVLEMYLFEDDCMIENISVSDAATVLSVSSSTIRNWIKTGLLSSPTRGYISIESLEQIKTEVIGKTKLTSRANKRGENQKRYVLDEFSIQDELDGSLCDATIGNSYENSLTESYRNKEGIYYTDPRIVVDMLKDIKPNSETTFLDPCCGCGNFLLEAISKGVRVENIYGFDTDPVAVEITKQQIYRKTGKEAQHIVCADFFAVAKSLKRTFDLIYTNPPWGKKLTKAEKEELSILYQTGESKDSCSLFVFASIQLLKEGGRLGFLLPESVLNIATFQSLRFRFLSRSIEQIKNYGKAFEGIQSRAYSIIIENSPSPINHQIQCIEAEDVHFRYQRSFIDNPNLIFNIWATNEEQEVIVLLLNTPHHSLKGNADWGLGIVTGDNKNKCKSQYEKGLVPVFRGKDIHRDKLSQPSLYIVPDLSIYQQTAPPSIYYADKKIIYRFISNCLVFFCDTTQALLLNSANALVLRENFPLSSEQLVSLLNSHIINWLFHKVFRTHKILRRDLEALPLFTSYFSQDVFDEERFLKHNKIIHKNGTFSITNQDMPNV